MIETSSKKKRLKDLPGQLPERGTQENAKKQMVGMESPKIMELHIRETGDVVDFTGGYIGGEVPRRNVFHSRDCVGQPLERYEVIM